MFSKKFLINAEKYSNCPTGAKNSKGHDTLTCTSVFMTLNFNLKNEILCYLNKRELKLLLEKKIVKLVIQKDHHLHFLKFISKNNNNFSSLMHIEVQHSSYKLDEEMMDILSNLLLMEKIGVYRNKV